MEQQKLPTQVHVLTVVENSDKKSWVVRLLKKLVIVCRVYILISPSLTTDFELPASNKTIYDLNLICSSIVLAKICLVLRKKRRQYFRNLAPCLDFVANCGVFLSSLLYMANSILELDSNDLEHYYFWALCCLVNVIAVFNHLTQFKIVSETLSVIILAVKLNYPFLFVILVLYLQCAVVGGWLFGGIVNSKSIELLKKVGQETKPEYIYQNWNDFFNSLVYLWGINLNNNINVYINISCAEEGRDRDFKPLFFFAFYVLNNVILRNIFFGQVIEISMEYFKTLYLEEKRIKQIEDGRESEAVFANYKNTDDSQKILRVKI